MKQIAGSGGWSRVLAAAVLAVWLFMMLVAASPALHSALHSDASHPDHHCCVTLLAQGHVDVPVCDALISQAPPLCSRAAPFMLSVVGESVDLLPPGRGPPLLS